MLEKLLNSIGLYTKRQYISQSEWLMETNDKLMEMTHQCKLTTESVRELNQRCTSLSKQLNEANIVARETERINETLTAENDDLRMSLKNEASRNSSLQKTIAEVREQKIGLINHINDLKAIITKQNEALEGAGTDISASVALSGIEKAFDGLTEAMDDMKTKSRPRKRKKTDGK